MSKKIRERKIIYDIHTNLKHIQTGKEIDKSACFQHKHEDYEIIVITEEGGKCFIGEQVIEYQKGDIVCIGRNVPHYYSASKQSVKNTYHHEGELLQFRRELFPSKIAEMADFANINNLLSKSQHGLLFRNEKLYKKIKEKILHIDILKGIERITELYKMLDLLGKSKKGQFIFQERCDANNIYQNYESLHKVYNYLYTNFKNNVTLEKVANHANLNPTALCRAFKRKTGVTIFQFLTRIRIENACKLLSYSDLTVSQVAYESGFNNMANFN